MRKGLMFILSSPSGAGKSTLARALLQGDAGVVPSVSMTTRPRRASEAEGVHYHFVSPAEFEETRASGGLMEWASVHGNLYGTPRAPVMAALEAGKDVVFDIDWQGTEQLYAASRTDILSVFVLPPSARELQARLTRRAEDEPEVIRRRLLAAREEIRHWRSYDHVLVNEDFGATFEAMRSILGDARRARAAREGAGARAETVMADVSVLVDELGQGLDELHAPVTMRM